MTTTQIVTIAIAILIIAGVGVVLTSSRRESVRGVGTLARETRKKDRGAVDPEQLTGRQFEAVAKARSAAIVAAPKAEVEPWSPPDAEAIGVSRRQFFNRATITLMSASLGGFGAAVIGFLWTSSSGGFGSKINVGNVDDVIGQIRANKGFLYFPEARSWITEYPKESLSKGKDAYGHQGPVYTGLESGLIALYQKCPHLGCRVPECKSSQWFECPCHGSQFNRVGEKKGGPSARGMDRFGVSVTNGNVVIDTGTVFGGPPIGTNTTGQEAEGPHCVGGGSH
jgi:cytochrome b6-f complex iron-sulfur subunit